MTIVDKVFIGRFIHSKTLSEIELIQLGIIGITHSTQRTTEQARGGGIGGGGEIVFFEKVLVSKDDASSQLVPFASIEWKEILQRLQKEFSFDSNQVEILPEDNFVIPGFIDTHAHAPQYVNSGTGTDLELLDWLNHYTFPAEAKHSDPEYSKKIYPDVVKRTLSTGTTTCVYFATIFLDSTKVLVDIISQLGQRSWVGKVCMDRHSPDFYIEETQKSLSDTEKFVSYVENQSHSPQSLVSPIITPRFAITATSELLLGLGDIAKKQDLYIQSHVSENLKEVDFVKSLFPERESYTDVYHHHNLLTSKTILAHGCHCSRGELDLFKAKEAGISHCPVSNLSLRSGILNVRNLLNLGVRVGLGTDISGGYASSMLEVIRSSVLSSNILQYFCEQKGETQQVRITWQEAFYLATLGGSQLVRMEEKLGNFEKGKLFDSIIVNPMKKEGNVNIYEKDTLSDRFQKYLFRGDERNHSKIFVSGRMVYPFQE